jgi:putative ABC transport system permease protein
MRSQIPQLLGLVLLLAVGVCFFITLFTIAWQLEETAEQYIFEHAYADVTFYGQFTDESVRLLSEQDGVRLAAGRNVRDFRQGGELERVFRVISLTDGINIPYIYEGRLPENANECVILKRNADAMNFIPNSAKDGVSGYGSINLGENSLTITGLVANPEYIYMVQNERTVMAKASRFAVVYVTPDFFPGGYNEIAVLADSEVLAPDGTFRTVTRKDQINHILYRNDLDELCSFAMIFPLVFAVLIAVVIYVILTRTIQKDKKQIGIMKALGMCDKKIIGMYLSQFCITAAVGALLGCFAGVFATDKIITILSSMFVVPALSFAFEPLLWAAAIIVSILLCAVSGMIALVRILPLLPAYALRSRIPKGRRRNTLPASSKMNFNTRYALKNSLRNKSRFFAVVLGMTGSYALLAFSFGFNDSIAETQSRYFNDFANYDVIISFNPLPLSFEHPASERIGESSKALVLHIEIRGENYMLAIVENNFDMVKIPNSELQNGVIVPEYFAQIWNVGVGDILEIYGYDAVISTITPQHLGLTIYTGYDYIAALSDEIPPVYNTLYGRSGNMSELTDFLITNNIDFATVDDDKTSFDSIMESMEVLIWFMILCSVILGFTVLYAVGLINLSAREYEYMFMGVMGYPHKSILLAHIKETLMQLTFALPLGFAGGYLLLEAIKGEFSSSNFVIAAKIEPLSHAVSALAVISVTAVMVIITSRHIGKLDIIEGLKAQEDG